MALDPPHFSDAFDGQAEVQPVLVLFEVILSPLYKHAQHHVAQRALHAHIMYKILD